MPSSATAVLTSRLMAPALKRRRMRDCSCRWRTGRRQQGIEGGIAAQHPASPRIRLRCRPVHAAPCQQAAPGSIPCRALQLAWNPKAPSPTEGPSPMMALVRKTPCVQGSVLRGG